MITINVPTTETDNNKVTVYNVDDYPYYIGDDDILVSKRKNRKTYFYYNVSAAYDIETTTIDNIGYMYHWQICIRDKVVFGRTWEEFTQFINNLVRVNNLSLQKRLVIYVHSLDFEFTFTHQFLDICDAFYKDKHKPLYVLDRRGIEFRCSYFLSNMSLKKFCENSKLCTYNKLDGNDYNYRKIRLPNTPMDKKIELPYCYCDVRGLCQCIDTLLLDDTISTIPLTSTGYVRRDVNKALLSNSKNYFLFKQTALTADLYEMCVAAKRGGNTHANRFLANYKLGTKANPVYSYDIKSSYPARLLMSYYPMSKFTFVSVKCERELRKYMDKYCCLIEITLFGLEVEPDNVMPYLPISCCTELSKDIKADNGRILSASLVTLTLTEIDLDIILRTYSVKAKEVKRIAVARRGKLPKELRQIVLDYFYGKTTLEDVDYYLYLKSKNKLNAIYGMMLSAIVHDIIDFCEDNQKRWTKRTPNLEESLTKHYNNRHNILVYQHGIWCVAHARNELQIMIDRVGVWSIYCDTDSLKFLGKHNIALFEERNQEIMEEIDKCVIKPYVHYNNKDYYMGIWEREKDMYNFKTLGSKKYCYNVCDDDKFVTTVAGMSKEKGAERAGSADNFFIGAKFEDVGRTVAHYNYCDVHKETINGCTFTTASNIGVEDTTYTLGVSREYYEILYENLEFDIDM